VNGENSVSTRPCRRHFRAATLCPPYRIRRCLRFEAGRARDLLGSLQNISLDGNSLYLKATANPELGQPLHLWEAYRFRVPVFPGLSSDIHRGNLPYVTSANSATRGFCSLRPKLVPNAARVFFIPGTLAKYSAFSWKAGGDVAGEKTSAGDAIPSKCKVIEVHVGELKQLFNAIDPSPFRDKDSIPGRRSSS
jgi:hypothetical protein